MGYNLPWAPAYAHYNWIVSIPTIPTIPTIPAIPTPWGCSKLKPISVCLTLSVVIFRNFVGGQLSEDAILKPIYKDLTFSMRNF